MSAVSPESDGVPGELPEPVLQQLANELLGRDGVARDEALQRLQAAHPEHAATLAHAAADLAATDRLLGHGFVPAAEASMPVQFGPYHVVRRLGEGAFGEVFLCRQHTPIERDVAVKVLRAGDRQLSARFAAERQLLAALQHPAIAQVLDAGALPDGRPYITMEYIDGTPFRRYCDERALALPSRLDLFLSLCRGVQHAHSRGIVHRDLKPSNVLVVEHGGVALPRIIDFGIAKLLERGLAALTPMTESGRIVGTPGYMSPEQAHGRSQEVDERADVFSLGVMLYELLCSELPWAPSTGASASGITSDPERPSRRRARTTSVNTVGAGVARPQRAFASALRGDLDWITLKCLHADPADRYQSVQDLVDDLERHRRSEPVLAGPPSVWYRVRKFERRHRPWSLATAATLVIGGLAVAVAMQFRSLATSSEARRLVDTLAAVERLATRASDPRLEDMPGSDELRQELVRDALALCERALSDRGEDDRGRAMHIRCLLTMADIHYLLGQRVEGQRVAEAAVGVARGRAVMAPRDGEARLQLAKALRNVARFRMLRGEVEGAAAPCQEAIDLLEGLHADQPELHANLLAKALVERAFVAGRLDDPTGQFEAQCRAIEVLEGKLRLTPDHDETQRDLVRFHCGLANIHRRRGDGDEADLAIETARDLVARLPLVTDEERAIVSNRLGSVHQARGRVTAAIAAFEESVRWHEALLVRHSGRQPLRETLALIHDRLCQLHAGTAATAASLRHGEAALATIAALPEAQDGRARKTAEILARIVESAAGLRGDGVTATVADWVARTLPAIDDWQSAADAAETLGAAAAAANDDADARVRLTAATLAACEHALHCLLPSGDQTDPAPTERAAARERVLAVRKALRK